MKRKIIIADCSWNAIDVEKAQFPEDWIVEGHQCKTEEDLIAVAADADGILTEYAPVTPKVLEHLKQCKIISNTSTGYDNIDAEAAKSMGIAVANVPNYCSHEVADHTLALILAGLRHIVPYHQSVVNNGWDPDIVPFMHRLQGQVLGLIGFGNIAQQVAKRAQAFGLQVIASTSVPESEVEKWGVQSVSLDALLERAQIISCHMPLTQKNHDFFNMTRFRQMKQKPLFVNTARGKIVVESDLVQALKEELISGAALDVLRSEPPEKDHPLFSLPNVIVTPHVAYYSVESLEECRRRSAQNVANFLMDRKEAVDFV